MEKWTGPVTGGSSNDSESLEEDITTEESAENPVEQEGGDV